MVFGSGVTRRAVVVFLCAQLLLPLLPRPAEAVRWHFGDDRIVTVEIGQPAVWSLAQAHYFLAQMHLRNRKLSTKLPDENVLDPNQIDASRIEVVQKLLGAQAQFDQAAGVKNRAELQTYQDKLQRRDQARVDLAARKADLARTQAEQDALDEQVAKLTKEDDLAKAARGKAPPTAADGKREVEIAVLSKKRDAKKAQVDALTAEVSKLDTAANADVPAPSVTTSVPTGLPTDFSNSEAFNKFLDSSLSGLSTPRLTASIALDNFVGMQYEIIAKQLSLLRDEVGPDERVIFLELPASIYTVDKHADDYVARVEWEVTRYYDREPLPLAQARVICRELRADGKTNDEILPILEKVRGLEPCKDWPCCEESECSALPNACGSAARERGAQRYPITMEMLRMSKSISSAAEATATPLCRAGSAWLARADQDDEEALRICGSPVDPEAAARRDRLPNAPASPPDKSDEARQLRVRAIEIIPHQSAVNINESTAATHGRFFRGILGLLNGLGLDIVSRSQSELYQKFVQQEVFAAGFGKGHARFGWTFGPNPGTKRMTPGQRTTYAVLAVPKNTYALELHASSKSFKRRHSPDRGEERPEEQESFLLSVPGHATEEFFVDGVTYTPVPKGQRATVLIDGKFFSPQLGVLVDGTNLQQVLSVARAAGEDEPAAAADGSGISGEYEVTNSREIALRFSMPKDYVGTPTITLVSPERSNAINSFKLELNHRERASLAELSTREPVFVEPFKSDLKVQRFGTSQCIGGAKFRRARLTGQGLRPDAEISVSGFRIPMLRGEDRDVESRIAKEPCKPFAVQESTRSYFLYVADPGDTWSVRYHQGTRESFDAAEFKQPFGTALGAKVVKYHRRVERTRSAVILDVTSPKKVCKVSLVDPKRGGTCDAVLPFDDETFRVRCEFPALESTAEERSLLTLKVCPAADEPTDAKADVDACGDGESAAKPARPKKPKHARPSPCKSGGAPQYLDVQLPVSPRIAHIRNPRTGRAMGYADEQAEVFIEGANLGGVTGVFFGDQAAKVTSPAGSEVLSVQVPKVEVAQGEEKELPVLLQVGDGGERLASGAYFVFSGAPLPKVLLCGVHACAPVGRPH